MNGDTQTPILPIHTPHVADTNGQRVRTQRRLRTPSIASTPLPVSPPMTLAVASPRSLHTLPPSLPVGSRATSAPLIDLGALPTHSAGIASSTPGTGCSVGAAAAASATPGAHGPAAHRLVANLPSQCVVDDLMQRLAAETNRISQPATSSRIQPPQQVDRGRPLGPPTSRPRGSPPSIGVDVAPTELPTPAALSRTIAEPLPTYPLTFNPMRASAASPSPQLPTATVAFRTPSARPASASIGATPGAASFRLRRADDDGPVDASRRLLSSSSEEPQKKTSVALATDTSASAALLYAHQVHVDGDVDFDHQRLKCGIFPTRFRREFIPPILCLLALVAAGVVIAVLLYGSLHRDELHQFENGLQISCEARARLLQQNYRVTLAVTQSLAGFFDVQQRWQSMGYMWTNTDWLLFIAQNNTPTYIDQVAFMPLVLDADRAHYENITGAPIVDFTCNPPVPPQKPCPNPQVIPRADFPYYFPFLFEYPLLPIRNADAVTALPAQGIDATTLPAAVAFGGFQFSDRQKLQQSTRNNTRWGIVATMPIYRPGANLSSTGNLTIDFAANMEAAVGVITAVLRADLAMQDVADTLTQVPLQMVLWDTSDHATRGDAYIAQVDPVLQAGDRLDTGRNATVPFTYGSRDYRLDCVPSVAYVSSAYSSTPTLIGAGAGIVVGACIATLLCGWLMLNARRSNQRAELLVESNASKGAALALLAQAKELADRANKSKSDFLAFLCHELRNPIHAISSMTDFIATDYFGAQTTTDEPHDARDDEVAKQSARDDDVDEEEEEYGDDAPMARRRSDPRLPTSKSVDQVRLEKFVTVAGDGAETGSVTHSGSGRTASSLTRKRTLSRRRRRQLDNGRAEAVECIGVIRSQVDLMRTIIDDCLDMAKIEAGVIQFESIGVDLAVLARQCVQSLTSRCKEKGVRLRLRVDPTHLIRNKVFTDPTRLKQVIMNLLTNAIKFTSRGAVQLAIAAVPWTEAAARAAEMPIDDDEVESEEAEEAMAEGKVTPREAHSSVFNLGTASRPKLSSADEVRIAVHSSPKGVVAGARNSSDAVELQPIRSAVVVSRALPSSELTHQKVTDDELLSVKSRALAPSRSTRIILQISVTDSGSGIDQAAMPHLFEPYSQEKLSIMRTHGGTGLGLAIVKNIISHLRGSIQVQSEVGKGSKFSLFLPIECRAPDDSEDTSAHIDDADQSTRLRLRAMRPQRTDVEDDLDGEEDGEDVVRPHRRAKPDHSGAAIGHSSDHDSDVAETPLAGHDHTTAARATTSPWHRAPVGVSSPVSSSLLPLPPLHSPGSKHPASPRSPASVADLSLHQWGKENCRDSISGVLFHVDKDVSITYEEAMVRGNGVSRSASEQPSHRKSPPSSLRTGVPRDANSALDVKEEPPPIVNASDQPIDDASRVNCNATVPPIVPASAAPARLLSPVTVSPPPVTPSLHFLLVDDSPINIKILLKMLGRRLTHAGVAFDLHLIVAANGVEAMERVEERFGAASASAPASRQFDLILSDIVMPLMDGFVFARTLRQFESSHHLPSAPLLALTANALKADADAYKEASFRCFVPKPFRRADLLSALHTILDSRNDLSSLHTDLPVDAVRAEKDHAE